MKTFKNTVASKSHYLTTVHFAQSDKAPTEFGEWVECDELELDAAKYNTHLFTQAGARYFGKL